MDILAKLGLKKQAVTPAPVPAVGMHGSGIGWHGGSLVVPWVRQDNRRKLEADLCSMDKNSPLVARMLDKTADYATCFETDDFFGFRVKTANPAGQPASAVQTKAVQIINEMVNRTELDGRKTWDIIRDMVKKGDVFGEVVIDPEKMHVAAVRQFSSSWQISKNVDRGGNLKTGDPALAMSDPKQADSAAFTQIDEIGKVVAAFWPYQVVQWSFGPMGGQPYAEPVGGSGIKVYKRLDAGMDSLGVARVIRAWDTNVHVIPMPAGLTPDEVSAKIAPVS